MWKWVIIISKNENCEHPDWLTIGQVGGVFISDTVATQNKSGEAEDQLPQFFGWPKVCLQYFEAVIFGASKVLP